MGTARIIRFRSCGTPVLARCAMTSEARQAVSPANRQEPNPESYPCSNRQPSRFRRRAWASTRSDSNGTMGTNWEFIRGSFCGMFARARSAGRCEQRRWDKVILCANSEILQEHIPGQLPLRTTGVLTERPGLTSRSGFLHAAAAAKLEKGHTKFAWQAGYGVFSVSESNVGSVTKYIAAQEAHHQEHWF